MEPRTLFAAGDLDPGYGTNGVAQTQFTGLATTQAPAAALQSDGSLIVAGTAIGSQRGIAVIRDFAGGSRDTAFGGTGQVLIYPDGYCLASAAAVQPDGKILVAGSTGASLYNQDFFVARLNANGSPDTTFNSTGMKTFFTGNDDAVALSIAVQSDGKIIVGGQAGINFNPGYGRLALARLTTSGALDTTFGTGGQVIATVTAGSFSADAVKSIAIDSTGRIVVGASIGQQSATAFGVARFTSAGALDTTFGTGGVATKLVGTSDQTAGVALQSDGKIVVAGSTPSQMGVVRFTSTGAIDTGFATSGAYTYGSQFATTTAVTVGVLSDGSIIAGGGDNQNPSSGYRPLGVKLTSAGVFSSGFGISQSLNFAPTAGIVSSAGAIYLVASSTLGGNPYFTESYLPPQNQSATSYQHSDGIIVGVASSDDASAVQADGKVIIAANHSQQEVLLRYNTDGSLDTTFGNNGFVTVSHNNATGVRVNTILAQSDGKIIFGATVREPGSQEPNATFERLLSSGALDMTFYQADITDPFTSFDDPAPASVVELTDGSYIVDCDGSGGGILTKLTPTGLLDTTYGINGQTAPGIHLKALSLDSAGRTVAGISGRLVRYTTNGQVDNSFNFTTDSTTTLATGNNVILVMPDGSILAVGSVSNHPAIRRYTQFGAVDTTFGSQGTFELPNLTGAFSSLSMLSDGHMIAVGGISSGAVVADVDSNGNLVTSFGAAGVASVLSPAVTPMGAAVLANGKINFTGDVGYNVGAVQLQGESGATILGTSGNDTITLSKDADAVHIDWVMGASAGQVLITDPAGLTINGNGGTDTITLAAANALPNFLHLNGTFTINGLTGSNPLANTALDINASTIFITYASPAVDPLSTLRGYLKNGYNTGLWNGTAAGVITSAAAAGNGTHSTAIGYADSADGLVPLPANTIELKYTLYGDTGLAGTVGFTDFMRMTQHYTQAGMNWGRGDFNYDGTVDGNDFNLLQPNYGQTLPAPAPAMMPIVAPSVTPARPPRTVTLPPAAGLLDQSTSLPATSAPVVANHPPKLKKHVIRTRAGRKR